MDAPDPQQPDPADRQEPAGGDPEVDDRTVPPRALGISLLALSVAALLGFLWPEAIDTYSGLVWLLALVPVFLLSYHRGWWGASVAALLSMVALIAGEVLLVMLFGHQIEWQLFGFATVILVAVTLGTGLMSEVLHQRRMLAEKMAYRDPVTDLANRRMIQRDAERAMAHAERVDGAAALIFFDLIRFKRINDELGFVAGDRALRFIGQRIRNTLREGDTVARLGGDEFAALLPLCRNAAEARTATERVKSALWQPLTVAGETVHVGARVGYALFPEDGEDFDELLSAATPRKSHEHGRALLDGPESDGEHRPLTLETDLVDAVETGSGLEVHYQPIARLADDRVVGAEALLRWDHPDRGMLEASRFVPIAERIGLIRQLERITLEKAASRARRWRDRGLPLWISINLSLTSLEADEARDTLARVVEEHSLSPGTLVAEVTERIAARDPAIVRDRLQELRESGLGLAVDDFGTGHSSLAYLERFPLDMLKVDQEFVAHLARGRRQQRLVEGIIGLTRGLDLLAVAEGVETEEQRAWLHSAGCHLYQGYLLARPCAASNITRMLEEGRLSLAETNASR